jgi:hypothetical protein
MRGVVHPVIQPEHASPSALHQLAPATTDEDVMATNGAVIGASKQHFGAQRQIRHPATAEGNPTKENEHHAPGRMCKMTELAPEQKRAERRRRQNADSQLLRRRGVNGRSVPVQNGRSRG